jgi:DNA topoisomerase-2
MSTTPPSKPKAKKAPAKKAGSKPLADVANESFGGDGADDMEKSEAPEQTGAGDKYQKVKSISYITLKTLSKTAC